MSSVYNSPTTLKREAVKLSPPDEFTRQFVKPTAPTGEMQWRQGHEPGLEPALGLDELAAMFAPSKLASINSLAEHRRRNPDFYNPAMREAFEYFLSKIKK